MFSKLINYFEKTLSPAESQQPSEHQLKVASAALLIEMMRMDHEISAEEQEKVHLILKATFQLNSAETEELFKLADEERENAVDYYRFATLINTHYSQQKKIELVENLWRIAYADHVIDKYEEHYLRKITELLHVPHKDFIKAKHRVISHE